MADRPAGYPTGDPLITEVSIRMFPSGSLRAFVDITLLGHFVVKGCKVQESAKGLWVSMPSEKNNRTGKWDDTFFPITADARGRIQTLVLNVYQQMTQGVPPSPQTAPPWPLGTAPAASQMTGRPSLFSVLKAWIKGQPIPQASGSGIQAPASASPAIPAFTQGAPASGSASATPWGTTPATAAPSATPWAAPSAPTPPAGPAAPWGTAAPSALPPSPPSNAPAPSPPPSDPPSPWSTPSSPSSSAPWGTPPPK